MDAYFSCAPLSFLDLQTYIQSKKSILLNFPISVTTAIQRQCGFFRLSNFSLPANPSDLALPNPGLAPQLKVAYDKRYSCFILLDGGWMPAELLANYKNYKFIADSNFGIMLESDMFHLKEMMSTMSHLSSIDLSFYVAEQWTFGDYYSHAYKKLKAITPVLDAVVKTTGYRPRATVELYPGLFLNLKGHYARKLFLNKIYDHIKMVNGAKNRNSIRTLIQSTADTYAVRTDLLYPTVLSCAFDSPENISPGRLIIKPKALPPAEKELRNINFDLELLAYLFKFRKSRVAVITNDEGLALMWSMLQTVVTNADPYILNWYNFDKESSFFHEQIAWSAGQSKDL